MKIVVGTNAITLTTVGRMVASGNTQTHQIMILAPDGTVVPGGSAVVGTSGMKAGQFAYATLPGPVVLQAGAVYYIMCSELNGGDFFYDNDTVVTTTSDASLLTSAYQIPGIFLQDNGSPNHPYPLDFTYTVGGPSGLPTTVKGSPFFTYQAGASFLSFGGPVTGTINLQGIWVTGDPTGAGTVLYQWTLNGNAVSPVLAAPDSSTLHNLSWPFDTTTVADGTYIIYPRFLDATSYPVNALQVIGEPIIIGNHGFSTAAGQLIPCAATSDKNSSPRPDFVAYDGVPNPIHNTYPVAYQFIPGSSDPTLRNSGHWYAEVQPGPRNTEYSSIPQFVTSLQGGVYVDYPTALSYSDTPRAYRDVVMQNAFDGPRLNAMVSPYTNYVEDPTTSGQWYGAAINGQVFKIDRHGNTTTVVGWVRDRSKLTLDPSISSLTEADIDNCRTLVGSFPTDLDLGGANDLCFDPRDPNIVYVVSQVDHWIAKVNIASQTVTVYAGTPGDTGDYLDGPAASAKFNQPASIIMASDGTMYVADQQNSAIRKITPGGTVSTLCGGTVGPTPPDVNTLVTSTGYAVSSITWNSTTQSGAVVMATPIANLEVGWTLSLNGAVNSSDGSGDPNIRYIVSAMASTSNFTIIFEPNVLAKPTIGMLSGSMTLFSYNMDIYSPPGTVSFTGGRGSVPFPNVISFTSTGNIVVGEAVTNAIRLIDLSGNTIRRIGCPDNRLQTDTLVGWIWLDVDSAGTCGPVDDIIIRKVQTDISAAHYDWRLSLAPGSIPGQAAYQQAFAFDNGSSILMPSYGPLTAITGGPGHYPWAIAMSRHEGRMITTGMANWYPAMLRIAQPGDPVVDMSTGVNFDEQMMQRAALIMIAGTTNGLPYEARPSFRALWAENGGPFIGNRSGANTFEDMMSLYPDDASLGAFIQAGMGGAVPRPELTGNDLRDLIYYIRRGTMQGSVGPTPVQPKPNDPDVTPSLILSMSATRTSPTSITIKWTTSKPTIGVAAGGSTTQAVSYGYYPLFSAIESGYGVSHSAAITVPSGMSPIHYTVVAKDMAGNVVYAADASVS
jgi:hypothetical protein